ncbi:hypothetical protein [Rubidibacter lacunae]|uniref:hypothetical protein n=1 Tax=Rubidibacter lacunae TaxID=582514 RepID=UPI0012EC5BEA|nr:hypothetical protein [Rubidibacter lacunae]
MSGFLVGKLEKFFGRDWAKDRCCPFAHVGIPQRIALTTDLPLHEAIAIVFLRMEQSVRAEIVPLETARGADIAMLMLRPQAIAREPNRNRHRREFQ